MLRDITLGQYYPVESPIHRLDPRTKLAGTLIFIVSLFLLNSGGPTDCRGLSFYMYPDFRSAVRLYGKRTSRDYFHPAVQRRLQYFPHTGRDSRSAGLFEGYEGRSDSGRLYGDPPDFPDYGIFADDLYHNTDFSDGWYGARPSFPECDPRAGA